MLCRPSDSILLLLLPFNNKKLKAHTTTKPRHVLSASLFCPLWFAFLIPLSRFISFLFYSVNILYFTIVFFFIGNTRHFLLFLFTYLLFSHVFLRTSAILRCLEKSFHFEKLDILLSSSFFGKTL